MDLARRMRWDWSTIALWAPVVGVAAVTQLRLGLEEPWTGSDAVLAATGLLCAVPLVVRRSRPVVTAALLAAALPVQEALGGALSFGSFVAVLVASYSVGRYAAARPALLGAAIILLGVLVGTREELRESAPDLVFPLFYVCAAASTGAVVRRLSMQAGELRELNAALARERDATARLAALGERMRLSRDLHDSVAHTLTVAVVQAGKCEQTIDDDPTAARSAALAIQEACRRGLSELRSVLRVLRDPDVPAREPGLDELEALAMAVLGSGLDVAVTTSGAVDSVPDPVGHQLFRVVQESLTNVLKHSAATTASVRVAIADGSVVLSVVDPGPALPGGSSCGGHGTTVMAERLALIGGHVRAGPDGAGYRVHAAVPLAARVAP